MESLKTAAFCPLQLLDRSSGCGLPLYALPLLLSIFLISVVLYRLALPKPLPGIPYNAEALNSILGDVPSIFEWKRQHGEQRRWFQAQAVKLNSPVIQIFTKPFARAQVVVVDHREIHDIFHRRHREFDRGYKEAEAFGGIIPDQLLALRTASAEFRFHKDIMKDLMLPAFLHKVGQRPEIYAKTDLLVRLWRLKADIARGRPFSAKDDMHKAALDIIMAVSFGLSEKDASIKKQLDAIANGHFEDHRLSAKNELYSFEELPLEPEPAAITALAASVEIGFNSPLPVQHHWLLRQLPHLGGAVRTKNNMTRREIARALARMPENDEEAQQSAQTALDSMLYRERLLARKAGREPKFYASYIFDECVKVLNRGVSKMLAYVIAGHDTTSNTLSWGLIYLGNYQQPQATLREQLQTVFSDAVSEKRQPTIQEIAKSKAPYLDATIEEILRLSVVLPIVTRQALVDTTILGHHIPKDTLVMCISNGPSFFRPGIPVDEKLRSKMSPTDSDRIGTWNPDDMHLFKPERWLDVNDQGETVFNARSGPMNAFGGGPRGCFGKRLAYLEIRVVVTLLLFNFKLLPISPDLISYKRKEQITIEPAECLVLLEDAPLWK